MMCLRKKEFRIWNAGALGAVVKIPFLVAEIEGIASYVAHKIWVKIVRVCLHAAPE